MKNNPFSSKWNKQKGRRDSMPKKQRKKNAEGRKPSQWAGFTLKKAQSLFSGLPSKSSNLLHNLKPSKRSSDAAAKANGGNDPGRRQKKEFRIPFFNKLFSIYFKLIMAFIVPVLLMVILGMVSFMRASDAITSNYKDSVSQAVNMTKEYFNFAFSSIEAQINTYLFDQNVDNHLKGVNRLPESQYVQLKAYREELTRLDEIFKAEQEGTFEYYKAQAEYLNLKKSYDDFNRTVMQAEKDHLETYKKINGEMGTLAGSSPFIQNILILNESEDPLTTILTLRMAEKSETDEARGQKVDYYTPFLDTAFGKKVLEQKTEFHWNGAQPGLDDKYDVDSNNYCLRVAHAYTNAATGYVIIDVSTNAILGILNDLHIGEDSYLGIVTPDKQEIVTISTDAGTADGEAEEGELVSTEVETVSNPKESQVEETIFSDKDFYQNALDSEMESGLEYVRYNGSEYLFMFSKIGDTGNVLCAMVPKSNIISKVANIRTFTIILVIIASLIALLIGFLISSSISKTIRLAVKHLVTISKGDLTVEFHMNRRDEFAQLADGTTQMVINFRRLIQKLEAVYRSFLETLHSVNDTSGTFNRTSKDIQTAVHEIELGINQQSDDATGCLEQMDSLFNRIGVVNENTTEIGTIATSTSAAIRESLVTMNDLKDKTKSTTDITSNVIRSIVDLEKKSRNIRQIVNAINDIAEETNLLSLNASIEAAKAGSAGKGFAVVADQIRKLADQSLMASSKINDIIEEIISTTKLAAKTAEKAETIVNLQVSAVDNTSESFNTMSRHVEELVEKLTLIQSSVKSMEASGSATLHSMESISSILEETSAASTSVTEIVDRQTEALGGLDRSASLMIERAEELENAIKQFKTK